VVIAPSRGGASRLGAQAEVLEAKHGKDARVHIWTKDASLKAHEPDHEAGAFVG
jgi:hypothetical protein